MSPPSDYFRFRHFAMNTVFEILISHTDKTYAAQAADEAFRLTDSLEQEMSRFLPNSDISRINAAPAGSPVQVGEFVFECLAACKGLAHATEEIFDITIGALLEIWLNPDGSLKNPSSKAISEAKTHMGVHHLELNEDGYLVTPAVSGISIDLGGFGKGYAVNQMAAVLQDWDIESALIHGGASSVLAYGDTAWPVSVSNPWTGEQISTLNLEKASLGASGLQKGGHIINPQTGRPVKTEKATWTWCADAAVADALSTSFLILDSTTIRHLCDRIQHLGVFILWKAENRQEQFGEWPFEMNVSQ